MVDYVRETTVKKSCMVNMNRFSICFPCYLRYSGLVAVLQIIIRTVNLMVLSFGMVFYMSHNKSFRLLAKALIR